jgi:ribose transport system ATP-binding protein
LGSRLSSGGPELGASPVQADVQPILVIRGLHKSFAGTPALEDVSLEVAGGEIHALLGQNGSGKSTLIKILAGYHAADAGSIEVRGKEIQGVLSLPALRRLGLSFLHQDIGLVDSMSVLENLRVGRLETGFGRRIRWRRERQRAQGLLQRFGLTVGLDLQVAYLSQTDKAILGIARALQDLEEIGGGGLLVLDEPTASLPEREVQDLFAAIRQVREGGSSVLFVTHRLEEVFEISDRVTVLRDGRNVATLATTELDHRSLVKLITGRELGHLYPAIPHPASRRRLARVTDLAGPTLRGVSFDIYEGEILGLTGLLGAGHEDVPYLLVGAKPPRGGQLEISGELVSRFSPDELKRRRVLLLPADRQRQAGIPGATVGENLSLPTLSRYRRPWGLDHGSEAESVMRLLHEHNVQPPNPDLRLAQLSGGNQQKALLASRLAFDPLLLLLHEPTNGVDIGSRQGIFSMLRDSVRRRPMAIVYASGEYEDLVNVCDRILVFRNGGIVGELREKDVQAEALARLTYRLDELSSNGAADGPA